MEYEIEITDDYEDWWVTLTESEQIEITAIVGLLEVKGFHLPHPYSSKINGSKHSHMRELRIQHKGDPYRVLYAFDPRRIAILLIGGNKVKLGDKRWYKKHIPIADRLYNEHLATLKGGDNG